MDQLSGETFRQSSKLSLKRIRYYLPLIFLATTELAAPVDMVISDEARFLDPPAREVVRLLFAEADASIAAGLAEDNAWAPSLGEAFFLEAVFFLELLFLTWVSAGGATTRRESQ